MFHETPPASIVRALENHSLGGQPVLFSTSTDLNAEGRPERQWIVLCGRRLVLLSDDETPRVLHTLAIEEAETFRTHAGVGSGFLQARVGGVWVDLVRYSNCLAGRFVKLAAKLEAMGDGGAFHRPAGGRDRRPPLSGLRLGPEFRRRCLSALH